MKIAITCALMAVALLVPYSAGAAGAKSGGTAMILSGLVLPGSGQMYSGETGRGVAILAAEIFLFSQMRNPSSDYDTAAVSAGFALATLHILQTADARRAAERANANAGLGLMGGSLKPNSIGETPAFSFDLNLAEETLTVKRTWRF